MCIYIYIYLYIGKYKYFFKKLDFMGWFLLHLRDCFSIMCINGQVKNQTKSSCRSTCREELLITVAFWERVKKASRRKSQVSASLSPFTFVGKWMMFARTLIKENLSPTILDVGLCFCCFSEEREEVKVRKHKNKTSFLMKCLSESTILQGGNLTLLF